MKLDPEQRDNKGRFPEPTESQQLDEAFTDDTVQKAEGRTLLFDFLHMIVVGFWHTLKTFLTGASDGTQTNTDKRESQS
ncbi:MAG: hypothetical protein R3F48_10095 [Candidatus Zixiibacteriota bacterium]